jgi:hypothetical protein
MMTSIEGEIIKMHLAHCTFDEIASQLSVARTRVARTIHEFHQSGITPEVLQIGLPRKSQRELVGFIEAPEDRIRVAKCRPVKKSMVQCLKAPPTGAGGGFLDTETGTYKRAQAAPCSIVP